MLLVVLTVVLIALLIAVLVFYLSGVGFLLNCVADNLDDCLVNVKTIVTQVEVLVPGVEHINRTGKVVAGALPLLYEGAEKIATKLAPLPAIPVNGHTPVPDSGRRRGRLMDTGGFRGRQR
jgi:hypothetical protein